jgi:serine/threonine protein kinase
MITKGGEVKILDFSISYQMTKIITMLTDQNLTTGTLPYMAPEQLSKKYGG